MNKKISLLLFALWLFLGACAVLSPNNNPTTPTAISVQETSTPTVIPVQATSTPTATSEQATSTPIPTQTPTDPIATSANTALPTLLPNSVLVDVYDPTRNPQDDLQQAILIAQAEGKHIMLDVGGDWCIWCTYLDEFFNTHPDLLQYRAENYVFVKINMSQDNENTEFLAQYPEIPGYPHLFVLDSDGTFLHSQGTGELEQGESYNLTKFMDFLSAWAPNP